MDRLDKLPVETRQRIEHFLESSNLERMSRTIIKLYFAYLRDCKAGLSVDFDDVLYDVEVILDFLEFLSSKEKTI